MGARADQSTADGGRRKDSLPAEIHAELVETLFGTVASFLAGIAGGLLVPVVAWFRTQDPVYLVCGAVLFALAMLRLVVHADHVRRPPEARRQRAAVAERLYALGAVGFMLTVGITAAILFSHDHLTALYGVVIALGCTGSLAGRNAGRPKIVLGQVVGICAPLALTMLLVYDAWYWGLAAIFVLILISVKSTSRFLNGILVSALMNGREAVIQRTRFSAALDSMAHGLCMGEADGAVTVVNRRLQDFFGLDLRGGPVTAEDLAQAVADAGAMAPEARAAFLAQWRAHLQGAAPSVFSAEVGPRIYDFRCQPEARGGFVMVVEDVTAERLASREIERMAHFDSLTGLPNRTQFYNALTERLEAGPQGGQLALLSVDLDQFKEVNDTRGHAVGDELLKLVAQRLRAAVKPTDAVGRFGGDEFQVLLQVAEPQVAHQVAGRIIAELSRNYALDGQLITIGASIGVAFAPRDARDADELLRCADMALYRAKAEGRGVCRAFEPELEAALRRRREVEATLREALAEDRLIIHYQPVVDSRSGEIVACEALVRLPHPTEHWISPAEFIPVAEESGLVVKLGRWVLRRACQDAAAWPEHIRVAVNFSPKQFVLGGDNVAEEIAEALADAGLAPQRLEVEITESTIMEAKDALQLLGQISQSGVRISLDDFGTGYSSLSYLRQFPVDKIKIDRSFAEDIESQASQAVIRSVSVLAGLLGVELVIEGIETRSQLDVLKSWNVHLVQGFYYSRPRPVDQLQPLLHRAFGRGQLRDLKREVA